jgi:hypothetical protein
MGATPPSTLTLFWRRSSGDRGVRESVFWLRRGARLAENGERSESNLEFELGVLDKQKIPPARLNLALLFCKGGKIQSYKQAFQVTCEMQQCANRAVTCKVFGMRFASYFSEFIFTPVCGG